MPDSKLKLIQGNLLIDGKSTNPIEKGAVLIKNNTILEIGSPEIITPSDKNSFEIFDFSDKTILPGLVDCHVHLNGFGDGRTGDDLALLPDEILTLQSAKNARESLLSGVTTARDCGAKNLTTFMLRKAINQGITIGPRLILSGRAIAIIGGHLSYFGEEVTGNDECRAAVRQLIKEGSDFIKITATGGSTATSYPWRPSFTTEEIRTICEEAHKFGKLVSAHCVSSEGISNSLDGGVDQIIHCLFREPDGSPKYRPDLTQKIIDKNIFVNATIHQGLESLNNLILYQNNTKEEKNAIKKLQEEHSVRLEHCLRMKDAGVKFVCGSDASWQQYKLGQFYKEIVAHTTIGLSPIESIISATLDSAIACGVDDQVGSIEKGKKADLIIVNGNPLNNIENLKNVDTVFLDGIAVN